ncbi:MAG: hypothetical protein KatS3mg108_0550 [Isosphaeraceae bacterium]|nr:MAG: hypothetical protein KatS3mg108_0550 [Isosphaeraceae bacterium]
MSAGSELIGRLARRINVEEYQKTHWTGTFAEYLDIVRARPPRRPYRIPAPLRHDPQPRLRGN